MLSKSDIQSHRQCARKLWLERKRPDLATPDDLASRRRATDGTMVGAKAREMLGADFIWPRGAEDQQGAATIAKRMLGEARGKPAAEVPMIHEGLYARADALIPDGGGYVLRETKASGFPLKADKISPASPDKHHLDDIAIQAWVMIQSGLPFTRAELNLLDNRWRYPGNDDYLGLFRQLEVTELMKARLNHVPEWVGEARRTLAGEMPAAITGKHCEEPYACGFFDYCHMNDPPGPEHPIELLPDSAGKKLAKKLRDTKRYTSLLEPRPEELMGAQAALYRRIQEAHRTGQAIFVPGSDAVIAAYPYPRYYFDFEAIDLPVPQWRGVRPYEHIPFQWSCHIERTPGTFEHREFLDLTGQDPSANCIAELRRAIDPHDGGPIFVYYATYEKGRLKELGERHPEHADLMNSYISRLVDLLPVVREHFYHPNMSGSFSIKKVLPVIAPELDYGQLREVQEGTGAQVAYIDAALVPHTDVERKREIEQHLRAYCRQDTWAMVEVAYFLARTEKPSRPSNM